ncbi:hypothetical protein J6590_087324 [Homalodisca vitripennis]|nr:hypothetical protein J6590_087324 [Homalodisca vitripennis]
MYLSLNETQPFFVTLDDLYSTNYTTGTRTAHKPHAGFSGAQSGQELTALCGDQRDDTSPRLSTSKHESSFNAGFCIVGYSSCSARQDVCSEQLN